MVEGIRKNNFCETILKIGPVVHEMPFEDFLFLALVAFLFRGAKLFVQFW